MEEQEHGAELREDIEDFVGGHPAQHARPDQDAGQNFADDPRLAEALEDLSQHFRGRKDHEHGERHEGSAVDIHGPIIVKNLFWFLLWRAQGWKDGLVLPYN